MIGVKQIVNESVGASIALGEPVGKNKFMCRLIALGEGSKAIYTEKALKSRSTIKAFPKGTLVKNGHDSLFSADREGEIDSVVGIIISKPQYINESDAPDGKAGLYSAIQFLDDAADRIEQLKDYVGLSVSAMLEVRGKMNLDGVFEPELDEDTGKPIAEKFIPDPLNRVDVVDVPGAGGAIMEAIERFRHIDVSEATEREELDMTVDELKEAIAESIKPLEESISGLEAKLSEVATEVMPDNEMTDEPEDIVDAGELTERCIDEGISVSELRAQVRKDVFEGMAEDEAIAKAKVILEKVSEGASSDDTVFQSQTVEADRSKYERMFNRI